MPELPEVETIRRSIEPGIAGRRILHATIRTQKLRHLLPPDLEAMISGQTIVSVTRRGKYLLLHCESGTLILHLGMTGNLHLVPGGSQHSKHDHLDLALDDGCALRFTDPRRFGTILWCNNDPLLHPLLFSHGPEPLQEDFSADYLYKKTRSRKIPIKQLIMNSHVVAGIGNIYASEALFLAGVAPETPASALSLAKCVIVVEAIKAVLNDAVESGSNSLLDSGGTGPQGYFPYEFKVYGKNGAPCRNCGTAIKKVTMGGRATFYCPKCQR